MDVTINGISMNFDDTYLFAIIVKIGLNPERVAVELNGKIVPRADFKSTALKDGDSLEIVHFVGGG